jgi:hypothetical protein
LAATLQYNNVEDGAVPATSCTLDLSEMQLLTSGVAVLLLLPSPLRAFYLPGAAPHDYKIAEPVAVFVNALTPMLVGSQDAKLVRVRLNLFPYMIQTIQ